MPAKGTTTARGYGSPHVKERKRLDAFVRSGRAECVRCGYQILPGTPWDLDHSDDRTTYNGPAHSSCNRRAGAIKSNANRRKTRDLINDYHNRTSREW